MSPQCRPLFLDTWTVLTLCVVRKRSTSWSTTLSWAFLTPEWVVQVQRWSPRTSKWNFLQPQAGRGSSGMTGIWVSMVMAKKVCQRPADQAPSLQWDLIRANQLLRPERELKRVYINGCRYNEGLNAEIGGSKTPHIHWVARVNIQ
jgi:hypothetical protein